MAWDGSGNYTRTNGTQSGATTWADADAAGNDITTSQHDTHDEDLADGIAACLTKNNESKPTADFKPNADATYHLGSAALQWKNLFLSGTATIASTAGLVIGTTHKWYHFNDGTYVHLNNAASGAQEGLRASTTEIALLVGGSAVLAGTSTELSTPNKMRIADALAIPAGGTDGQGYSFSSTANFGVFFGSGAPTLNAAKGSLYLRSNGSTTNDRAYINTDGGTTWTALTTAA